MSFSNGLGDLGLGELGRHHKLILNKLFSCTVDCSNFVQLITRY